MSFGVYHLHTSHFLAIHIMCSLGWDNCTYTLRGAFKLFVSDYRAMRRPSNREASNKDASSTFFICMYKNLTLIFRFGAWAEVKDLIIMADNHNLSKGEGDFIKTIFGGIIDIIVDITGGKPTFGKKK